jgi:hypothetical protein
MHRPCLYKEGNFSIFLQSGYITLPGGNVSGLPSNITQTGLVPANAQSIIFKAQPGTASLTLSLNVQTIPFFAQAIDSNYTLYGADISAFAGQVSELAFTTGIYGTGWNLDSIEFSSQPVPEPTSIGIFTLATILISFNVGSRELKQKLLH